MSMGQCICGTTIKDSDLVADTVEGLAYQCSVCKKIIYYYNDPRDVAQPKGDSPQQVTSVMHSNATEIENLKCCGNCMHRSTIDMGSYSDETCDKDNNLSSWQYCKKWEFDGIERSGRTEVFNV